MAEDNGDRFIVVECGDDKDLFVIWDKQESQVIDVMTTQEVERYRLKDVAL